MNPIGPSTPEAGGPAARPLRVLVAVHQLDLGGSQMNAVDLAAGVQARGHEVIVAGPEVPLVDMIRDNGLRYERVELDRMNSAVSGYRGLMELGREVRPDLVHAYELIPSLLTYVGSHWRDRVPMTMTINSMAVPEFMPGSVPLQVCNPVIAAAIRPRTGSVGVLEIPTDCVGQRPDFPGGAFREEIGVGPDELLVVVVSRFARALKQQGLETAIRAAGRLAPNQRMRLVLVGDGPAMPDLRALATAANAAAGREVVILTGSRSDPRPAYAAADVVLGMGGSLLRAMAFGKPCIVQGENGFWQQLDAGTARAFRWRGFYGIGDGGSGEDTLVALLERLLADDVARKENGVFALDLVRQFYSLDHAVDETLSWYAKTLKEYTPPPLREIARTMGTVSAWVGRRTAQQARGVAQDDFFNSRERIAPGIRAAVPEWFDPDPVRPSHQG